MNRTILLAIVGVLAVGTAGWFFIIREPGKDKEPAPDIAKSRVNLILGDEDAAKTIIEYGDYKCPNCAKFHAGSYVELKRDYLDTGKAKIVFKNVPYIAEDSRVAAEGTYCANEQGLFEEYHDGVYDYISDLYDREGFTHEFKNILTPEFLSGIIKQAGGNPKQFSACVKQKKHGKLVDEDLRSSEVNQVSGTPTFIIDQQKIVGAQPITIFRTLLEAN
jgi:protein-disulfide isomerase